MTITKEILIYANVPYKKYRWIGYMSAVQLSVISVSLFMRTPLQIAKAAEKNKLKFENNEATEKNEFDEKKEEKQQASSSEEATINEPDKQKAPTTRLQRLAQHNYGKLFAFHHAIDNIKENPFGSIGMLAAWALATVPFAFYAKRSVHTITLLPNQKVRFSVFSPVAFRKPETFELPLNHVSCRTDRKAKYNYSILKIKDRFAFHLVHKNEGTFIEPKLFDKYLAYEHVW